MRNCAQSVSTHDDERMGKLLAFDRKPRSRAAAATGDGGGSVAERSVVAVVTITRFIDNERVHAQVPVFADQIAGDEMIAPDLKTTPDLSELLADGAVEANSYLDRLSATRAARALREFSSTAS